MHRRSFLQAGAAASVVGSLPRFALAEQQPAFDPKPAGWRTFEITTRVEILKPQGASRAWIPVPAVESDYQKVIGSSWSGNASTRLARDGKYGAAMAVAEWSAGDKAPVVEVTSTFSTINRAIDFSKHDPAIKIDPATAKFATAPTELIPTDGIVRRTAYEITRGKTSDIDKARAIYDWIVVNTFREAKVRGCGVGDIKAMLETGNLGGKCADLNALYVGLARSVGLPARDVYGIRVAKSEFGYRSLGAGSPNITRAQHCRAEVFLTGYGWVPVDPADVRKVVLEEKAAPTTLADPVVPPVRAKLFGAWEMNWLAYNEGADLKLPGSSGPAVGFLMYPQAETGKERLDPLDPDNFKYTITARELKA
ncbi:MAG TPA: transglutaminase domain-containing protein [Burkholderiales bacterium]|jgi:transglutaminase-like putative cysteine protease